VTGRGLAANLRTHFPPALLYAVVCLLLVANVIISADTRYHRATHVDRRPDHRTSSHLALSVGLQIFIRIGVAACAQVAVRVAPHVGVVFIRLPWRRVPRTIVPRSGRRRHRSPPSWRSSHDRYLDLSQASEEVEEQKPDATTSPLKRAPRQADAQLGRMRADTWLGMAISNVVGFFVILTAAAVFNAHGVTTIQTTSQAAEALRPAAGGLAYLLFALGSSALACSPPVLAGSAAYAVGEAYRWPVGLRRSRGVRRGSTRRLRFRRLPASC
jgi:hypothetical protein